MTQDWADMHGWPQLAATAQRAYGGMPQAERAKAIVFAKLRRSQRNRVLHTHAATYSSPYVMPYENDIPIFVCRGITQPIAKLWPRAKHYE